MIAGGYVEDTCHLAATTFEFPSLGNLHLSPEKGKSDELRNFQNFQTLRF